MERRRITKALLICIYADSNPKSGGFHGPLWEQNLSFEGIPIPTFPEEELNIGYGIPRNSNRNFAPKFNEITGIHNEPFSAYIPPWAAINAENLMHFDPDPIHLTFGERFTWKENGLNLTTKVPRACVNLKQGDILLWAARLRPYDNPEIDYFNNYQYMAEFSKVYLVGYIEVERVLNCVQATETELRQALEQKNDNAHLLEADNRWQNLKRKGDVIVYGKDEIGGQLKKAIPITDHIKYFQDATGRWRDRGYPLIREFPIPGKKYIRMHIPYWLNYERAKTFLRNNHGNDIRNPILPQRWR